jgi:ribosomal protein S18 acetylase RimI-like enzyme
MHGFRVLEASDVAGIAALYVAVFNAPPWNDGWSIDAARERLDGIATAGRSFGVIATDCGVPVAFALGYIDRWISAAHFHLTEMCVAVERQRRGVGADLLHFLERELRARGVEQVFCETRPGTAADSFYRKAGFRQLNLVSLAKRI